VIGKGHVGTALSEGLQRLGREVRTTGHDPDRVRDVARWADLVILAVPFGERRNAVQAAGRETLDGKTVVDVTNALGPGHDFVGDLRRSGAEEVQEWCGPGACVVKAFNTVFAQHMAQGQAQGEPLTLFCAGDDPEAKQEVQEIGRGLGFDAVDAGPLAAARWLEPLGYLNIQLAHTAGLGADSGFRYVHANMTSGQPARSARGRKASPATWSQPKPSGTAGKRPPRTGQRADRTKAMARTTRKGGTRRTASKPR